MNYIYDIVLNFHKNYYDFFEWKKEDKVVNINKIKLFRVNEQDYLSLKYNNIIFDINIFKMNLTSYKNNYIFLVSTEDEAMAIMINKSGKILARSSLIFEEEDEVVEVAYCLNNIKLYYKKNQTKKYKVLSRLEKEKIATLNCYIKSLDNKKDNNILKYLYYDYYESEANDSINIKEILLSDINNKKNINKIYDFVKLLTIK